MNFYLIIRLIIGIILLVSGFEKIISPYQNFLYVIQSYQLIPAFLEILVAQYMPWFEFFVGVFLVLGLCLKWSLRAALLLFGIFIFVVGQALVRKLPIGECGCFGSLLSFPLPVVIGMDIVIVGLLFFLMVRLEKSKKLSLDHYFAKES